MEKTQGSATGSDNSRWPRDNIVGTTCILAKWWAHSDGGDGLVIRSCVDCCIVSGQMWYTEINVRWPYDITRCQGWTMLYMEVGLWRRLLDIMAMVIVFQTRCIRCREFHRLNAPVVYEMLR